MEKRLGGDDLHCPVCRAEVEEDFLDLPGLHDEAPAGVRDVPPAARGAVAGLPVLRDADRARRDTPCHSPRPSVRRGASVPGRPVTSRPHGRRTHTHPREARRRRAESRRRDPRALRAPRVEAPGGAVRDRELARSARRTTPSTARSRSSASWSTSSLRARRSRSCSKGEGAIATCRKTIGATNPADADPGSLRGEFALAMPNNLVHGSDSPESAEREIGIWFPDGCGLTTRPKNAALWTQSNAEYTDENAAANWALDEILWGIWGIDEVRAERPRRRERARRRRARLRHRVLLGVAREARRASDRRRHHAGAARDCAPDDGRDRDRVPADRGRRRGDRAAGRLRRPRRLRVRRVDLGRPVPLDPRGRAPAPPGRPARVPSQLDARDPLLRRRGAGQGAPRPPAVRHAPLRVAGRRRRVPSARTASGSTCCARTASRSSG